MIYASAVTSCTEFRFYGIIDGSARGHFEVSYPLLAPAIEVYGRITAILFYRAGYAPGGGFLRCRLRTISCQATLRADVHFLIRHILSDQPEYEIHIVAALGYENRRGIFFPGPEASDESVCHTVNPDIDTMPDRLYLTQFTGNGDVLYPGIVRVIAHHIAHRGNHASALREGDEVAALVNAVRHRLLQKQIHPRLNDFA